MPCVSSWSCLSGQGPVWWPSCPPASPHLQEGRGCRCSTAAAGLTCCEASWRPPTPPAWGSRRAVVGQPRIRACHTSSGRARRAVNAAGDVRPAIELDRRARRVQLTDAAHLLSQPGRPATSHLFANADGTRHADMKQGFCAVLPPGHDHRHSVVRSAPFLRFVVGCRILGYSTVQMSLETAIFAPEDLHAEVRRINPAAGLSD